MGNKTISKNSIIVLFLLHLSLIVFLPQSAYSWGLSVHTDMARDAANLIPNNLYTWTGYALPSRFKLSPSRYRSLQGRQA
jgi:hypothetical protein